MLLIEQRADLFNRVLPKNQSKPKQQNQPRENVERGKEWATHLKIQMAKSLGADSDAHSRLWTGKLRNEPSVRIRHIDRDAKSLRLAIAPKMGGDQHCHTEETLTSVYPLPR